MPNGTAKSARHNDRDVKVTITKKDSESATGLSFTEQPVVLTFENHAPQNANEEVHSANHRHSEKRHNSSHRSDASHDKKGASHSGRQSDKSKDHVISGLNRNLWHSTNNSSISSAVDSAALTHDLTHSRENTQKDVTKEAVNNSHHTISLHITKKDETKSEDVTGPVADQPESQIIPPAESQKEEETQKTIQEQAEQENVPLDRHSSITGAIPSNSSSLFTDGGKLVPSSELYAKMLCIHRSLIELEEKSMKVSATDAEEGSSTRMTHKEFRLRRNKALLQACLSIEKEDLGFLGTDMGARVYQPIALRKIYYQMDHGVEPTSISQERLISVRKTIRHDRHALNKMMGSEAKQNLKKTIYGNRMSTFKLADVITKTIVTAGTLEQPDVNIPELQHLHLDNYYPSSVPSLLLLADLEEITTVEVEEFVNFKVTCSTMIAEIGYALNQVTESNSKAIFAKIISILSTYLVPQGLRFLGISLLVFWNCILEKAALERVFVPVYASIFSEIMTSTALAKQLVNSYPNFNKHFRKKCEEKNISTTSDRAYTSFMSIIFREIMEIKLEDMLYNIDLNVPFFKRIEVQQSILDKTADGTIIQHSEQDQQCIRDYIASLQDLYIVNLAVFAAHLYASKDGTFITPSCLRRIFLNLTCYNASYNYICQTDTWAKYNRQQYFNRLYLPAVNMEINRLHTEKRYRRRIDVMKFYPDKYMPKYTLYEAVVAIIKIIAPCMQHYLVEKYLHSFKAEVDALASTSNTARSRDSSRKANFTSFDSLRQYLNDGELITATNTDNAVSNYEIIMKYLFANTEFVHMTFPYIRKMSANGDAQLYQIISHDNLEELLWSTPELSASKHTNTPYASDRKQELAPRTAKPPPGAIMLALAEKIGLDSSMLETIRLFSDISRLYSCYMAPMHNDSVHVYHFRFLIIELNDQMENLFETNISNDRLIKLPFLSQLKKRLQFMMNICKKNKIITAERPPLISTTTEKTNEISKTLSTEIKDSQTTIRKPILSLPTDPKARKELLSALRTETLESSLRSAVQCVMNLEYDQEAGRFMTHIDTWSDILSELLLDTVIEAGMHTSAISAVANCIPDLLLAINRDVADIIPASLWELLIDGALTQLTNERETEKRNALMNSISFMIITLIHKQVFNFLSIARDLAARAKNEECAHNLGKAIVAGFLVAVNEDDDSPSHKLLAISKQNCTHTDSRADEKLALYELVNVICAIYTRKPPAKQDLEDVYNVLRENKALPDVFSIYNVVVCDDSISKKKIPVSTVFSQYLEQNKFLFRGDCIHNTFDIVCGIAMSFVPSASPAELSTIFSNLGDRFASQGITLSTLAGHVFQRWKETVYCSRNFILIWDLLIQSKLCGKAAVVAYIKSIPSFTDIKKQIQDSEVIRTWLAEE